MCNEVATVRTDGMPFASAQEHALKCGGKHSAGLYSSMINSTTCLYALGIVVGVAMAAKEGLGSRVPIDFRATEFTCNGQVKIVRGATALDTDEEYATDCAHKLSCWMVHWNTVNDEKFTDADIAAVGSSSTVGGLGRSVAQIAILPASA